MSSSRLQNKKRASLYSNALFYGLSQQFVTVYTFVWLVTGFRTEDWRTINSERTITVLV